MPETSVDFCISTCTHCFTEQSFLYLYIYIYINIIAGLAVRGISWEYMIKFTHTPLFWRHAITNRTNNYSTVLPRKLPFIRDFSLRRSSVEILLWINFKRLLILKLCIKTMHCLYLTQFLRSVLYFTNIPAVSNYFNR